MDPARTRKNAKRSEKPAHAAPHASSSRPSPYPSTSSSTSRPAPRSYPPPPFAAAPPPSTITTLSPFPTPSTSTGKGSFPTQSAIPSSFPRPSSRPIRPVRDRAPPIAKAAKPENSSLNLLKEILPSPLPSKESYPNLVRLDLGSLQGEGSLSEGGVGWIGKEWGNQLTWLNLSGNEEIGQAGEGFWDGFGLLRELIVLNVSSCKMSSLPEQFASLTSLKAFVATGNEFEELDSEIVAKWKDLNSLIVSQNPLKILPSSLPSLQQLSKLSSSHTLLSSTTLPDLSPLPHLRMLSLSHNPDIVSLPRHFSTWGTGLLPTSDLANARPNNVHGGASSAGGRRGDGLEVVELGGCGLDKWEGLKGLLGPAGAGMKGLRSLGLRGCGVTKLEGYGDRMNLLLPSLQILDNTRIVARKAKRDAPPPAAVPASPSPEPEPTPAPKPSAKSSKRNAPPPPPPEEEDPSQRKRKRKSRANGGEDERAMGGYGFDVKTSLSSASTPVVAEDEKEEEEAGAGGKKRKRSRKTKTDADDEAKGEVVVKRNPPSATGRNVKRPAPELEGVVVPASAPVKATRRVPAPSTPTLSAPIEPPVVAAPKPVEPPKPVKKTETSVLKIVEVPKKGKGKKKGVDLVELFGAKKKVELGAGGGEGEGGGGDAWGVEVGGWD